MMKLELLSKTPDEDGEEWVHSCGKDLGSDILVTLGARMTYKMRRRGGNPWME